MNAFPRSAELDALVGAYTQSLAAAGMSSGFPNDSVARSFFVRVGIPTWQQMTLDEQLTVPKKYRRVVSWLLASQRMRPTAAYLVVARPWSASSDATCTPTSTLDSPPSPARWASTSAR